MNKLATPNTLLPGQTVVRTYNDQLGTIAVLVQPAATLNDEYSCKRYSSQSWLVALEEGTQERYTEVWHEDRFRAIC